MAQNYELILGNCLDVLPALNTNRESTVVITDPPYGIGLNYSTYDDTLDNWKKMFTALIPELKRVASMIIMPSCQIRMMEFIYRTHPPDWLICWYKGSPGHSAYVGFNDWEPLLVYGKRQGVQMHDYLKQTNTEQMGNHGHPCPKPVAWARWLIDRASRPGDTIIDPFVGSGTTGVAALMAKRNFIGIDIDANYISIAQTRIKNIAGNFALTDKERSTGQMGLFKETS